MPQLFEMRYNSQAMKIFSGIVIFIFLLPYSASVYKGPDQRVLRAFEY